ncbi:ABC transporter permease [Pseudogracilibacillus auburnensis]|uniref:Ribose transport system permease protein n=1 Tax=Pseudogracilibacillus auburnensis TaxID=1494959 RepID=A0A2V3VWF7_9BACI|nr:ABC transporter permease [Pseudogracilibacillus auburnensis]MBO1002326.1 ABC transporter permease [Pseudogracilibacillus auburnensis]PXW86287.1 ribose transport system permease protein [Pseudogracilibacillus auburnensis]
MEATKKNVLSSFSISSSKIKEAAIVLLFIVMFILASVFVDDFFNSSNIINLVRQISFLAIIGLGQFFVILIGGIDMSVGSTVGLVSIVLANLMSVHQYPIFVAIIIVLLLALFIGFVNGLISVYGHVTPFIATLITMIIIKGVNYLYSNGIPISGLPSEFNFLGAGYVGPIPFPIIVLVVIGILCYVLTTNMKVGRSFYAVGGNLEASKLSGINVNKIRIYAFMLSSFLAGVGAILITSRTMSGQPAIGESMLFDIITIVVLGGTSLTGGRGKVVGVIFAALILGIIDNVMVLKGIDAYWQQVVKGVILAIVVLIDSHSKKNS